MHKVSEDFFKLVEMSEGLSLKPYLCPAGKATIGYGTTVYPSGIPVSLQDNPITKEDAKIFLISATLPILKLIEKSVKVSLKQNQIDALVDFIYNVGAGNFLNSTLLKKINKGDSITDVVEEFYKWDKATINGVKQSLKGLLKRRMLEADLYKKI